MTIETTEEKKKKQTTLLILALIIFIAAFAVFYFGFLNKRSNTSVSVRSNAPVSEFSTPAAVNQQVASQPQIPSAVLDARLKKTTLNVDFLTKNMLSFLKTYGNLPVEKGIVGKNNPFSAQ